MSHSEVLSWEAAVKRLQSEPNERALVEACFYDDPLIDAARRYHASLEWQAVDALLGPGRGSALDVGSGRGISAYALACDGWRTTALEPDPSAVVGAAAIRSLAAEAGLAIDVVETWGEQLPFESNSFELVHCRQVLHHARDLRQLCREVARVLKPGGRFIATREHVISRPADLPVFLDMHPLHRLYGGENAFTLTQYTAAIEGAGIRIDRVFNPYQSDINTYPVSLIDIKRRWARKLRVPTALLPDAVLGWAGRVDRTPGRLYSFLGSKPTSSSSSS